MEKEKKRLRLALAEKAKKLDSKSLRLSDEMIQTYLFALDEWKTARMVFIYISRGIEPNTISIIEEAWRAKKRIAVPQCLSGGIMEAREITAFHNLVPKRFGIMEPNESFALVRPDEIDLVIVPCVAMDVKRHRLGHGGGYYDRYLANINCSTICLCHEAFMLESIPANALDVRMEIAITGERIYR